MLDLFGFGYSNHACDSNRLHLKAELSLKSDYTDRYQALMSTTTKIMNHFMLTVPKKFAVIYNNSFKQYPVKDTVRKMCLPRKASECL